MNDIELRANVAPWTDGVEFLLCVRGSDGLSVARNIEMTPVDEGAYIGSSFSLSHGNTQALMDYLWRAGFRPTEAKGGDAVVGAMSEHIKDLRRVIFDKPAG